MSYMRIASMLALVAVGDMPLFRLPTFRHTLLTFFSRFCLWFWQIVGPNGSGKSTVVSGVCIVFGGKLKLLGRSTDLGAYVRHGAENAEVEAFIYDPDLPGGVRRIKRQFSRQGNSSYFIDGKKAKLVDIDAEKKHYDIQLDNLSQFMPQEKIAQFINHNDVDLLSCTIRALGGTEKLVSYDHLCVQDVGFASDGGKLEQKKKALAESSSKAKGLETEVKAFEAHKAAKAEIERIERYLPWAYHRDGQAEFTALKADLSVYNEKVTAKESKVAELQGPLQLIKQRHKSAKKALNEGARATAKKKDKKAVGMVNAFEDLQSGMDEERKKLVDLDRETDKAAKKVEKEERKLDSEKKKLAEALRVGNDAEDNAVAEEAKRRRRDGRAEYDEATGRHVEIRDRLGDNDREMHILRSRDKSLGDVRENRLSMLEKYPEYQRVREIARFIKDNAGYFRAPVHGPAALEIGCENEYLARIMCSIIPRWFLGAFVVECHADGDVLRSFVNSKKLKIAVLTPPLSSNGEWDKNEPLRPARPVDGRLQSLGITSVLCDVVAAPEAVMQTMNAQFQMHRCYVGEMEAERHLEELAKENDVNMWFTPKQVFVCRTSKYNRSVQSTTVDVLRNETGLFAGRMEDVEKERALIAAQVAEKKAISEQLRSEYLSIEKELKELTARHGDLDQEARKARERIHHRGRLMNTIKAIEARIRTHISSESNTSVEQKKKKCVERLKMLESEIASSTQSITAAMEASLKAISNIDEAVAEFSAIDRELRVEDSKHQDSNEELLKMREVYKDLKSKVRVSRIELRKLQETAEKSISSAEATRLGLVDLYGNSPDDVKALLRGKQEEANRMTTGGSQVVKEYERLTKKIEVLAADVERMQADQATLRADFESDKKNFLEWLNMLIDRMARRFSELYKGMGCRGDIQLVNKEAERMSDLAIHILVSYRDDVDLRKISKDSNSGGEKMCATMYVHCIASLVL